MYYDHRGVAPPSNPPMTVDNPRVRGLVDAIRSGRAPPNAGMVPNAQMQRAMMQRRPEFNQQAALAQRAELAQQAQPKPAMLDSLNERMRAFNEGGQRVVPGQRSMAPGAGPVAGARPMQPGGQIPPQVRARLMALQRGNPV